MNFYTVFLVLSMAMLGSSRPINVIDYGAVGDGKTDDTQAFVKAWETICGADQSDTTALTVPKGRNFLVKPTRFEGPCKSPNVWFIIRGKIIAPSNPSDWSDDDKEKWIVFASVDGLIINGDGLIDGQGSNWWQSCPDMNNCRRPSALSFHDCKNLQVSNLNHVNSQRNHISISSCHNATFSNLSISAPETSPNTDGIDISSSSNILISNSYIGTGDDCIAINTGCSYINITGVDCGPGHGISIGSLGINGEEAAVEEIHVKHCSLNATQNGARIKTWQGGSGYARKISFENITLNAVDNPIIIDQFYCPHDTCQNQTSAVEVSDVSYTGIFGTAITDEAIALNCSTTVGCTNIVLQHINITSATNKIISVCCINAHGKSEDTIPKVDCLSQ